jgi:hypothetical protein
MMRSIFVTGLLSRTTPSATAQTAVRAGDQTGNDRPMRLP